MGTVGQYGTDGLEPRGNEGQFSAIQSATFNLVITNPCITSQVDDITLLPDDYTASGSTPTLEARVDSGSGSVSYYYESPDIIRTLGFSSGITECGDTDHYIADYDEDTATYSTFQLFHQTYNLRNSLYFYQDTSYSPVRYYVELDPTEDLDLGKYHYGLVIEMADYPSTLIDSSSTWSGVTPTTERFDVIINPCLVTSLDTAVIPEKVEYIVGDTQKSVSYSYTQYPCSYDATYSILEDNGTTAPDFIEQLERYPIMSIYTVDEDNVGNYTIEVTMLLDNVALFNSLDSDMDDYIADVNDPEGTYSGNSADLIYTISFTFDLEIKAPETEYEEPDNTPPYLLPPPEDQVIELGSDKVEYFIGDAYDAEIANQTLTITVSIDSGALGFVEWNDVNNYLIFRGYEADALDVGYYDISIKVEDNFATAEIEDYVECEDRVFAT